MANPNRTRVAGAVVAGLLTNVIPAIGTDSVLHATGVFPPWGEPMADALFALPLAYRIGYGVLGCWVAGRIDRAQPLRSATILGLVGLVISLAGLLATWNAGPEFGPRWYPIAVAAIALPCAWVGGVLARHSSVITKSAVIVQKPSPGHVSGTAGSHSS